MECKYGLFYPLSNLLPWINRYIMECKSYCEEKEKILEGELIDTLWNVNKEVFADAVSASQN